MKLTEYNGFILEKLTVAQLIKKFFTFHGDVFATLLALRRHNPYDTLKSY
jgi:hypothetical protein